MKKFGKILLGSGLCVFLGPLAVGMLVMLAAPHFPHMAAREALGAWLMILALGSAVYGPLGLLLIVGGIFLIGRANTLAALGCGYVGRTMQYQLALHFRGAARPGYEAMIELQTELIAQLGSTAAMAGHDMGAGTMTVFIHTADPALTFEQCKPVLARLQAIAGVIATYRLLDGDDYQVLWPQRCEGQLAVA